MCAWALNFYSSIHSCSDVAYCLDVCATTADPSSSALLEIKKIVQEYNSCPHTYIDALTIMIYFNDCVFVPFAVGRRLLQANVQQHEPTAAPILHHPHQRVQLVLPPEVGAGQVLHIAGRLDQAVLHQVAHQDGDIEPGFDLAVAREEDISVHILAVWIFFQELFDGG